MAVVGIQAQAGLRFDAPERITKRGSYREIETLDPDRYTTALDDDGVAGAVLFPSNAHQCYRCIGGELLTEVAHTYNDWILEYCAAHPSRLKAVCFVNPESPRDAAREMQRCANAGAGGILIPILPPAGQRYDQLHFEPMWAAAQDAGLPLLMHVGGNQAVVGREPVIDLVHHATKDLHFRASVAAMVLSGVFARFSSLRLGIIEFGASWVPPVMEMLDRVYQTSLSSPRLPSGELPTTCGIHLSPLPEDSG
jgi:predicted TIM-barrel fold metal-dependent hydrolase